MQQLSKSYVDGPTLVKACDDVTLSVKAGEFCLVRGPSGSGKSTMLLACAGLVAADAGTVVVDGRPITDTSERERAAIRLGHVGVVFQDFLLVEEFSAVNNVLLPLEARAWSDEAARAEAERWLSAVGIGHLGDRMPGQLSGGQRQRVGIARALAGGRRLILADEPTGALDSTSSREVFELLAQLATDGVAVVLASHDPQASDLAHRTFVMTDGRLDEVAA